MAIVNLKGMIMDVAPDKAEAIAVWLRSGFNDRHSIWLFDLEEKGINTKLIYPVNKNTPERSEYEFDINLQPWKLPFDTLWRIVPKSYKKLKYIYVFSNPKDEKTVGDIEEIDKLINQCLTTLNARRVKSVAMILIPASIDGRREPTGEGNKLSAKRMISSIQNWLSAKERDVDIYLVDKVDDFAPFV
jgi:hypothetical protein